MRPSSARNLDAMKRVLRAPACHCLLMTSRETLHDKSTRVFPDGKKFLTNTINTEETPAPLSLVLNWTVELKKWVPRPRHSLRPSTALLGWERARERTRAREFPRATAPRQPSRKEPFSRSSMADWSRAWDIINPSAPLPIVA